MKRVQLALLLLALIALACGKSAITPSPISPTSTPAPTADTADLWYLTRGDSKSDQAWGVDVDNQGNVYIACYNQSPATDFFFDMVIYKFAPDGTELWKTEWGGDLQEKAFIVTVDEPYLYVGGLQNTSAALIESDMAVIKLEAASGKVLWSFTWGQGFGYEEIDGLVVDGEDLYLSGWTTGETTGNDIAVLKLDKVDGRLIWAKTWGDKKFDSADGQMVVDEQHIYVSGRTNGGNILVGGEGVIVKFDKATGAYSAHRTWGGPLFTDGLGLTSDGKFLYVVGLTLDRGNGGQIYLLKYDQALNLQWEQVWGGTAGESARVAVVDSKGNIIIAGNTESYGSGKGDLALLSFSPEGNLNWSQTWGGPLKDAFQGIAIQGNTLYIVGSTENNSRGLGDALLLKADAITGALPPNK